MQSLYHIEKAAAQFTSCKYLGDLEQLLEEPRKNLSLLSIASEYYVFTLPKADGSSRLIEAPYPDLKRILKKLNYYLQSVYFLQKPAVSYGYVINYRGNGQPRNMLTNAERHIGSQYLLNVDFEDFFHQVTIDQVQTIFASPPFRFTKRCVEVLTGLCCFKQRLPMGSPTSPVLSNFSTQKLDKALMDWTSATHTTYTRFVDDLSFSGDSPVSGDTIDTIRDICKDHHLNINAEKTKVYSPTDTKIVTGLEVADKVSIPSDFYYELSQDIKRLSRTMETSIIMIGEQHADFVKNFQKQVLGKINFIGMVHGAGSEKYQQYFGDYDQAIHPDIERLSLRWMDFPYQED